MAHVLALSADLLFGSQLQGALSAAGHDVRLLSRGEQLRERLREQPAAGAVLVVDLADRELGGVALVESLARAGELRGVRTLGVYSHVDVDTRTRAQRAGFDLLVPRSRMAREAPQLLGRLARGG